MGIDYPLLHKILKDPTRREILRCLDNNGPLSYMELMNLLKITNTGRFNYHLKALGDLVEKMEDGRYRLTEGGQLAVQLLKKFSEKTVKAGQSAAGEATTVERFLGERVKKYADIPKKHLAAAILVLIIGFSLMIAVPVVRITVESPSVRWQQFLPGISGTSVIQTSDGGYLALGVNASVQENDVGEGVFVNQEPILVKTDSSRNIIWTKTYQAEGGRLELSSVIQTSDGGYALGGVDIIENVYLNAENKISLMKIDSQGNVQWSKLLTGYNDTRSDAIGPSSIGGLIQTSDQGYAAVTGYTHTMYISETWFVKTDAEGNLELNKTISPNVIGYPLSLVQTNDGYTILGSAMGRGGSGGKVSITKIDSEGNVQWYKLHGENTANPYGTSGAATSDGGYVLGGYIYAGRYGWVVRTDAQGEMVWNANYSYAQYASRIQSISQAKDGGFMFVGTATSNPGEFNPDTRFFTWVSKIDSSGNEQGEIGIKMGNHFTHPTSIMQAEDGGFVFVGTWNESFQATSDQKFWLVKIADFRSIPSSIWLFLQLAIAVMVIIIETAIALAIRKRIQKTSITR